MQIIRQTANVVHSATADGTETAMSLTIMAKPQVRHIAVSNNTNQFFVWSVFIYFVSWDGVCRTPWVLSVSLVPRDQSPDQEYDQRATNS